MKRYILILSVLCLNALFQSCVFNFGSTGTNKNDAINTDVHNAINKLNQQLFKNLVTGNASGIREMLSPELAGAVGKRLDTLVGSAYKLKPTGFRILDDYHVKHLSDTSAVVILSGTGLGRADYTIRYPARTKETFVSLMISKGAALNFMVMAVYAKQNQGWKISLLHFGDYEAFGKTAPDYYDNALDEYNKGDYINAMLNVYIAKDLSKPASPNFRYSQADSILKTSEGIISQANHHYKFPIELKNIKNKPAIVSVRPQFLDNKEYKGVFPVVAYHTNIPLRDTVALKAENEEIKQHLTNTFNGIEKNKYIFYVAFNQAPNGVTPTNMYRFIQKIK